VSRDLEKSEPVNPNPQDNATPDFPEGGWRAWATVAGAFCSQMCGFGYTTSFGVYQDYYTRFYITSESPSTIAWIGSVNSFLVIASGLFAGRLYDKGYFYHMIYGGSCLIVFSLFMLSLSHPDHIYQNFLTQSIGHGIGAGLMYVPSLAVLSHYFVKKRALAMSIVATGASLGAVVHPIMLNNLFVKISFGNAVRASAGLNAGLLLIACLLMHPRLPPPDHTPNLWKSLKKFLRDGPYVSAAIGLMAFPIGMYFPLFFIQLDAVKHGLSRNFAFYALVIVNGSSCVGRLSPGIVVRYIGVVPFILLSTGMCAIMIFALIGVTTVTGFVVFGILYGFSAGAFIALMAPLIAVLSDNMSELGLRMGIAFTLCGVGALAGPPISGALLSERFIWWKPAVFSGTFGLLGTAMFGVMAYLLHRRHKLEKRSNVETAPAVE